MYNHQLDAFIKAADLGSFSKAASELFISPVAVIQQVTILEQRLGVKLLIRSNKGVKLTAAGSLIYEKAKEIISLSKETIEEAQRIDKDSYASIRIYKSPTIRYRYLNNYFRSFKAQHPEVRFEYIASRALQPYGLNLEDELGIIYDLSEGVYISSYHDGHCKFLELVRTPICVSVPQNSDLRERHQLDFADLSGCTILGFPRGVSKEIDKVYDELEKIPNVKIDTVSIYDSDVFKRSIEENKPFLGPMIWQNLHPDLISIPFSKQFTIPYGIVYAKNISGYAEKFINTVKEDIEQGYPKGE